MDFRVTYAILKHKVNPLKWVLVLCMLIIPTLANATDHVWSADEIPMVHLQDNRRYVCDPDNILSNNSRSQSDSYLYNLHHKYGVQTVFIVVNRVKNGDCFRMAQDVGNHYGVGTKKDRRRLVIVIAVKDRRYFIAPGKGLEGELTDVECNDIAEAFIVKNMRVNKIDSAVCQTSRLLLLKFKNGNVKVNSQTSGEKEQEDNTPIILFLIILFCGPLWMLISLILQFFGIIKPEKKNKHHYRRNKDDDDWFPPFIFGGGGGFSGGGGSIGGSFGGGGSGGSW